MVDATTEQTEIDVWDAICYDLQGTCQSLDYVLEETHNRPDLQNNTEFLGYLDDTIFCCTSCDWWCEISEEASEEYADKFQELICRDCVDQQLDQDED